LSTKEDVESIEAFFKDKDTSKYNMALAQMLETIRTRVAFIEVRAYCRTSISTDICFQRSFNDLNDWLAKWEKRSKL
jgi:aminopeptidase 2